MRKSELGAIMTIVCLGIIFALSWGCAAPRIVKTVELSTDVYACKLDPASFSPYQGKHVLMSSIRNKSRNTTALFYFDSERTVGYRSYFPASTEPQPVEVYFWYGLQKAFGCAGIRIEGQGTGHDAELSLTFHSLTDVEIIFTADLTKADKYTYSREYTVRMPPADEGRHGTPEQRAYGMLDAIVSTMLKDPEFGKTMLKPKAPAVHKDLKYEHLRGLVLKNGAVVEGEILNREDIRNSNAEGVQIRTAAGRILSYPFESILFFY